MPRVGLVAIVLVLVLVVVAITPSTGNAAPATTSPAPASLVRELDRAAPTTILRSVACPTGGLRLLEVRRRDLWGDEHEVLLVARPVGKRWSVEEVAFAAGRRWAGCTVAGDRTAVWVETDEPGYVVFVHDRRSGTTQHLRAGTLRPWEMVRIDPYRNSAGVDIGVRIVVGDKTREAITWRHPDGFPGRGAEVFCGNASTEIDAATTRR